jgi:hypothetical protein
MASTYEPIATTTLSSAASQIEFGSISGSFTDLVIVFQGKTASATNLLLRVGNGSVSTTSLYSWLPFAGDGTAARTGHYINDTSIQCDFYNYIQNDFGFMAIINFMNYSNTTTYKTILHRDNHASLGTSTGVAMWRSTSAIDVIRLYRDNYDFAIGTTATLFGIKAA